jgi:hypothetical protein
MKGLVLIMGALACRQVTVRKSVDDLTEAEWKVFLDTIRTAQQQGIWEEAAQLHLKHSGSTHGGAQFHFWHRVFLRTVEEQLQKINPQFSFPYFDSSLYHDSWLNHPIVKRTMGYSERSVNPTYKAYGKVQFAELFAVSMAQDGFAAWGALSEAYHSRIHNGLGGDMSSHLSPRDPVFYTHHAFVDYEWSKAQVQWSVARKSQWAPYWDDVKHSREISGNNRIQGFERFRFADLITLNSLCYRYAHAGEVVPAPVPSTSTAVVIRTTSTTTSTRAVVTSTRQSTSSTTLPSTTSVRSTTTSSALPSTQTGTSSSRPATQTGSSSTQPATQTGVSTSAPAGTQTGSTSTGLATQTQIESSTAIATSATTQGSETGTASTTSNRPAATQSNVYEDVPTSSAKPAPGTATSSPVEPTKAYPEPSSVVYVKPTAAPKPRKETLPKSYKPMAADECTQGERWNKWAKMNNVPVEYGKVMEESCKKVAIKYKDTPVDKLPTVPLYTPEDMDKVKPNARPIEVPSIVVSSSQDLLKSASMSIIVVFASLFL